MRNIHNVVSDVQDNITTNHFPVKGSVREPQTEWIIVEFRSDNCLLQFEVHIGNEVSCVLKQNGFTNDQRDAIMEVFTTLMFA